MTELSVQQAPSIRLRYMVDVIVHLVGREWRLRYRRALLGWMWAVVQPLARFFVLVFVFSRVARLPIEDYPLFLFVGVMAWGWFSSAVSSATSSAVNRQELLYRPRVPRVTIPVMSALTDFVDLLVALPILAVFLLVGPGLPWTLVILPLLFLVQLLLILGLGFALCSLNVYLRDTRHLVDVALVLGFYATPIVYSIDLVPSHFRPFINLNPMTHLVGAYRDVLIAGTFPPVGPFLLTTLASGIVFIVGLAVYQTTSPFFVDES